jgi:hypothetical protein
VGSVSICSSTFVKQAPDKKENISSKKKFIILKLIFMIRSFCFPSKITKIKRLETMKPIEREIKMLKKEKKAFNQLKLHS